MHGKQQFFRTFCGALALAITVVLIVGMFATPAFGQNPVPPTARQAASMPQFASRLHPAQPVNKSRAAAPPRFISPQDQVLYENGPASGTTDAWQINFGYIVSDTFTITTGNQTTVTGFDLYTWEFPGDKVTALDWSITSSANGGTVYGSGTVSGNSLVDTLISTNQYGYNIDKISATGLKVSLNAANYYLNLQNASVPSGNPVYWDENSGVGCHSQGCPSLASESSLGTIPSEAFDVVGSTGPPPPPPCFESAGQLQIIYDFTGKADGSAPSGVAIDKAGNVYGPSSSGGDYGHGVVYRLAQKDAAWMFTPLYIFSGGDDGSYPSPVIVGPEGGVYGGAHGLIFNLKPSPTACLTALCSWMENVLYRTNGVVSAFDRDGNLYGTSPVGGGRGGCGSGCGTVFELTPSSGGWTKSILYAFAGDTDGTGPTEVLVGNDGNLYGVAGGGAYGDGVVFQLTPSAGGWTESVLHNFQWGTDGGYPSSLVQDSSSNLYGVAQAYSPGIIFTLSRSGGDWVFGEFPINHHVGGFEQLNNLAMDAGGNLYGTGDGGQGCLGDRCDGIASAPYPFGYVFEVTPGSGWRYQDLAFFQNLTFLSRGPLAIDAKGNVYGVTPFCGKYGQGTVWQVSP